MRSSTFAAAGLAAIIPSAFAQTYSDCNPTNASQFPCPVNAGLNVKTFDSDFTSAKNTSWSYVAPSVKYDTTDGAAFTVSKRGEAPTIKTDFYIFYGKVEVTMKSAPGQGIISSIVLQSEDLDEIDWEFLGGNNGIVQTNYFGKGNTTTYDRMQQFDVATPQDTAHTYSVDWTKESIVWAIDGTAVRTLNYADANGGSNFPQSPMNVRLGIWAGGDPDNDYWTIQWAGGNTTYDAAAGMPWSMYVQDVKVTNYNPGCSYNYTDTSGSSESISINTGGCDTVGTSPTASASASASASATASGGAAGVGADGAVASQTAADGGSASATGGDVSPTSPAGSASSGTDVSETDSGACIPVTTVVTQTVTLQPGETAPVQSSATPSTTADVEGGASSSIPVETSTTDELGSGTMTLSAPTGTDYPIPSEAPVTSGVEGGASTPVASVTTPVNTPTPTPPMFTGAAAPTAMGGARNALLLGGVAAILAL